MLIKHKQWSVIAAMIDNQIIERLKQDWINNKLQLVCENQR